MTDNPKYDKFTVERVKNDADIRDFIPGCSRKPEQMVECPFCHSKKLSVVHKWKNSIKLTPSWSKKLPP